MPSESTTQPSVEDIPESITPSVFVKFQWVRARQSAARAGSRPGPQARHMNDLFLVHLVQLVTELECEFRKAVDVNSFAKVCRPSPVTRVLPAR